MSSPPEPEYISEATNEERDPCERYREAIDAPTENDTALDAVDPKTPTTTVMIYLAGDNNLSEECVYALTELKKARPNSLVRVFAQYDPGDEFLPTQRGRRVSRGAA